MTNQATLLAHLQVCAELYQLAHDENRHLKEQQTVPPAALLERKRQLLERLDQNLTSSEPISLSRPPAERNRSLAKKSATAFSKFFSWIRKMNNSFCALV